MLTPEAAGTGAASPAIRDSREALASEVGPPRSIGELLAGPAEGGPRWWLPSLLYLAYQATERDDARAVLDELASRRDELGYAVVEEETDDVIGLSIQPWPLVDDHGRLRFPINADPLQAEVLASDLAELVRTEHERWHELGLLQQELVDRRIHMGDAYALVVGSEPGPSRIEILPRPGETHRYLGGLPAGGSGGSVAVPLLDVTWDAREAGKLAHHAAAGGVLPDELDPATRPSAEEAEARYLIGLRDGVDPRDVRLSPEAGP